MRATTKKYNKKEAFAAILKLKTGARTHLTDDELDRLLLHFAPTSPKLGKGDAFDWVARAVERTGVRPYLATVCVRGGKAMASDGHRAHIAPCDLPPGLYCPKTREPIEKLDATNFPDLTRIWPMSSPVDATAPLYYFKYKTTDAGLHVLYPAEGCRWGAQRHYLREATDDDEDVRVTCHDTGRFSGESKHGKFLIMGVEL